MKIAVLVLVMELEAGSFFSKGMDLHGATKGMGKTAVSFKAISSPSE